MAKFRKPVVIEATQWFRNGDHPRDACYYIDDKSPDRFLSEGKIIRYYRHPEIDGDTPCISSIPCAFTMHDHGWIDTPEGGHTVCPGDWVITGIAGEVYPCKAAIFEVTYEAIED